MGSLIFLLFVDAARKIIPMEIRYVVYADDIRCSLHLLMKKAAKPCRRQLVTSHHGTQLDADEILSAASGEEQLNA